MGMKISVFLIITGMVVGLLGAAMGIISVLVMDIHSMQYFNAQQVAAKLAIAGFAAIVIGVISFTICNLKAKKKAG
jgi:hypothetical protein